MADFTKTLDDLKKELGALAEKDLKEFAGQGKADAMAFVDDSRAQLEEWFQQLANGDIDEDELRELIQTQTDLGKMQALQEASAGQQKIDNFRDSALSLIVTTALNAIPTDKK
jgi:hypothetical protein